SLLESSVSIVAALTKNKITNRAGPEFPGNQARSLAGDEPRQEQSRYRLDCDSLPPSTSDFTTSLNVHSRRRNLSTGQPPVRNIFLRSCRFCAACGVVLVELRKYGGLSQCQEAVTVVFFARDRPFVRTISDTTARNFDNFSHPGQLCGHPIPIFEDE